MTDNYYLENLSILTAHKEMNPLLNEINLENNILSYGVFKVDISPLNFRTLKSNVFELSAYDFIQIIKIHVDTLNEIKQFRENDININYVNLKVLSILSKEVLSEIDINQLDFFINSYLLLRRYQDYISNEAYNKFVSNTNLLRDSLYGNDIMTPGKQYIIDKIENDNKSYMQGKSRILSNQQYGNDIEEKKDILSLPKAGFASISIVLVVISSILALMLIVLFN